MMRLLVSRCIFFRFENTYWIFCQLWIIVSEWVRSAAVCEIRILILAEFTIQNSANFSKLWFTNPLPRHLSHSATHSERVSQDLAQFQGNLKSSNRPKSGSPFPGGKLPLQIFIKSALPSSCACLVYTVHVLGQSLHPPDVCTNRGLRTLKFTFASGILATV